MDGSSDSFVSRTMSAILSEFQFTFDAGCVGQMPLRVFPESQIRVAEEVIDKGGTAYDVTNVVDASSILTEK